VWASSAAAGTRAALPAWARPALGPDALANPLMWMPPAALTCLFDATDELRMMGMLVFFLALRRMFRLNRVRLAPATLAWLVMGVLAWMMMAGALVGLGADAGPDPDPDAGLAPVVSVAPIAPAAITPAPARVQRSPVAISRPVRPAGAPEVGDWQPPQLYDSYTVIEAARAAYTPALRSAGVGGEAVLRVWMDDGGAIDPASIEVARASDTRLGFAAASIARTMRYHPALVDGAPVAGTVEITFRFDPEP
jgi:TonB family protein